MVEIVGLRGDEVAARVASGQTNAIGSGPSRTTGDIVRANVVTRFNAILGSLLAVILVVGPIQDALFGIVLVLNTLIGIIQELRAKATLDRLALLAAPRATARRDASDVELALGDVVLDDVLRLTPGEQVVVDGVVLVAEGLEVDESLLTGEADPLAKDPGAEVLSGSFVTAGSGWYRATRVGADSYASQLAAEARRFTVVHSELRAGIDRILRIVTLLMVPVAFLLVSSQLVHNENLPDAIRGSVAGVGSMIPEGLVLLTSVAMAVGVIRLGRRRVLVQELPAVEVLARVDVVCLDKTGTLTEGTMALAAVETLDRSAPVEDALGALAATDPTPNPSMTAISEAFGDESPWSATHAVPFSSSRKWSGATFGHRGSWVLGAPEVVAAPEGGLPPPLAGHVRRRAAAGQRVLLLARSPEPLRSPTLPAGLQPVAVVALEDRIRPDARATLDFFARQGVALKVISGDSPLTVSAVAGRLGMPGAQDAVDARELPDDPALLADTMDRQTVFGRVAPHQKRAMVQALQARGHVVAMTGDGVNDVLALKDADIGVALGAGSGAARAVSQLVLLDNGFHALPAVVAEGRRVIANVERVANLFLTKTVYATLLALSVGVAQLPFPFLPRHLTVVSALTIGIPAFFLALAPNAARARPGFVRRVLTFAIPAGTVAGAATFAAYALVRAEGLDLAVSRTTATAVLFGVGMTVLAILARPLTPSKQWLLGLMGFLFVAVLAVAPVREFYGLVVLPIAVWVQVVVITGMAGLAIYSGWEALVRRQLAVARRADRRSATPPRSGHHL